MIKLIVSDMDGSLLDDAKHLPPDFSEVFHSLQKRKIPFVIASGRSYVCLDQYLKKMPGAPACICDNGAYVIEHGKVADVREIPRKNLERLLDACNQLEHTGLLLCGIRGTYYVPNNSRFDLMMERFYRNRVPVENLSDVDDVIFKVGIDDPLGAADHSCPLLQEAVGDAFSIRMSGVSWIDITNRDVTKGSALGLLQKRLGVTPEETMAFGDHFNDIELLGGARYSFVMGNAVPEIRSYGNYVAKTNREYGVTDAIRRYVLSA